MRYMLFSILLLLFGCADKDARQTERPANVPVNAKWSGGVDGGSWFNCNPIKKKWHYDCVVYNDFDGQVEDEGVYVLRSVYWSKEQNKMIDESMESFSVSYNYFDGDMISLNNTLALIKENTVSVTKGQVPIKK